MPFAIKWDSGWGESGVWDDVIFKSYAEAKFIADSITEERVSIGFWNYNGYAKPTWRNHSVPKDQPQ